MTKYMLISVCEREICTAMFPTIEDARMQMIAELQFEIDKRYDDIDLTEPSVDDDGKFVLIKSSIDDEEEFGYGDDWAWSNVDDDYYCDWKIVEV